MTKSKEEREQYREHFTKRGIYERRARQYQADIENFHSQKEPLFDIFELRAKWEEFEELTKGRQSTSYDLFLFLLKQSKETK